jgi:hypothetical protein
MHFDLIVDYAGKSRVTRKAAPEIFQSVLVAYDSPPR